ncbi:MULTISPECIES: YqaA family protein [Thiomicrorhabdus]|uniref:DedA family protein n=1 Tax=Thiomicrorhabdus heinhorstiae TaxID=2748010 RepID=A0ABS0BZI0_9GAMM|nr:MULTISPECIES: YqaA family protein [Thiomicrorhabdus]MBF6058869.1 DedA family protein [Thiomicrorhabdus heinhorstiae]
MDALISLFFVSLLAATLFPAGSEILLLGLAANGENVWALWMVATLGNTLGSVVNYLLGRYLLHFQDKRWFPIKAHQLHKSQNWFQKYGIWSLLFAWLPIVGDPLTLIAGIMRVKFWLFALLTLIGKGVRYAVLLGLFQIFTN